MARLSSASATQTLACVAATTSGLASESRSAVARLMGKWRSVVSVGAGLSLRPVARGLGPAAGAGVNAGVAGGNAGGKSRTPWPPTGLPADGTVDGREGG
ncbi:MAG TPA: hypothetical protein VGZ22_18340 [Isosphaeraceae bacterium]|nr:hypothetical protein [Isosphaeraceae bacterium]